MKDYGVLLTAVKGLPIMEKQALFGLVSKGINMAKKVVKPTTGSVLSKPVEQAAKAGGGVVNSLGKVVPVALGTSMAHRAFIADPVSAEHLAQAQNQAYYAAHNRIGNRLGQGGFLQSLALKFNPSMAFKPISQATGAQMPGQQTSQSPRSYANMRTPATTAQTYNQTTKNF